MRIIDHEIVSTRRSDTFRIYHISDPHIGNIAFDRPLWEKSIKHISDDPHGLAVCNGDLLDLILGKDKRVDPDDVDPDFLIHGTGIVAAQEEYAAESLRPLIEEKKLICIHAGNHDQTWKAEHYKNVINELCGKIGVPYASYTAFIRLKFAWRDSRTQHRSRVIIERSSHGAGGGRTKGAILNHLHNLNKSFDADAFVQGHTHRRVCDIAPRLLTPPRGEAKIVEKLIAYASTGSFFQTYRLGPESSYGERRDYPPGDMGGVVLEIAPWGEGIRNITPLIL
jgi:UDP-2,3-diacylglucosamine pyrophosphatase LpxH